MSPTMISQEDNELCELELLQVGDDGSRRGSRGEVLLPKYNVPPHVGRAHAHSSVRGDHNWLPGDDELLDFRLDLP